MAGNFAPIGRSWPSPNASVINRTGGGNIGTMSNWTPRRLSWPEEGRQREAIINRANDIASNNAHGASLIESIAVNAVGSGLWPQSKPNYKRLGITEEQAQEVGEQMEWEFEQFAKTADATAPTASTATNNFYGMQYQNIYSLLVNGEFINLPLMINDSSRRYGLALQSVDPIRLKTPFGMSAEKNVRDGIRLGKFGQPSGYFLADPEDGRFTSTLDLSNYREIVPNSGHRPNIFHRFHKKTPEQVRGVSILAPAMKFFRDVNDYLDFELVGSIIAASFPVWIEKQPGFNANDMAVTLTGEETDPTRYQELNPGSIFYGNQGEKPHVMGHQRPGGSFQVFVETMLRAVGASVGMPYEIIAKDFSKTNYSSARAALEEAWRVFGLYQDWMVSYFCQVIWEMVMEEAFLKGYIKLPKGSPDFYSARAEWTAASWIVPERTQLDPVKEMTASIMGLNANVITAADIAGKRNKDWEDQFNQRSREVKRARQLDLPSSTDALKPKVDKTAPDNETETANHGIQRFASDAMLQAIQTSMIESEASIDEIKTVMSILAKEEKQAQPINIYNHVHVPEQQPPNVDNHIHVPEQPTPVVNVDTVAPVINIDNQPANISINVPEQQLPNIDNHIHVPEQPAPIIYNNIESKPAEKKIITIERDMSGNMTGAEVSVKK